MVADQPVLPRGPHAPFVTRCSVGCGADRSIRESDRRRRHPRRALLVTAVLIFDLVRAGDDRWNSAATLGALAAAVVLYAV